MNQQPFLAQTNPEQQNCPPQNLLGEIVQWDAAPQNKIDQYEHITEHQQIVNNLPSNIGQIQQQRVQHQQQKTAEKKLSKKMLFMSLQDDVRKPIQCQSQQLPNSLQILEDEQEDGVTIVSASVTPDSGYRKRRRQRRKNRPMRALQIDSKEESVQEIRQEAPKHCIELEPPQPPAPQPQMTPYQQQQFLQNFYANDADTFNNIMNSQQEVTPIDVATLLTKIILNNSQAPVSIQGTMNEPMPEPNLQFQNLFQMMDKMKQKSPDEGLKALATLAKSQVKQARANEIHTIVPLIDVKIPQICQQYIMITSYFLITGDEQKFDLRKLIKSNYKQQIAEHIFSRLSHYDASYNYANVQVLKMIKSGYVWDNVIPYMAECLYKDSNQIKVRLLPQKSNSEEAIIVRKYQVFLVMCQMFFGILPRQIATYDLPISFGEIMTIGDNDSALTIENKLAKLKCLLHYFSSVLREKEAQIKNTVEFISFKRFRYSIKQDALCPKKQNDRIKFRNVRLTDHLSVARVKYGNEYKKQIALYLTHENPCRESGEQSLQTPYLMQQTYRMMYSKPQIFILKALTPKLDLGQAIAVYGLQEFSKCGWQDEKKMQDELQDQLSPRKFVCGGLLNQVRDLDGDGKRKGAVILIMSKLLFNQTYIKNDKEKSHRITENYSFKQLKIQIQTLYSAFQAKKIYPAEFQRIIISERYIKFIQHDYRWLYFMVVWIASSLAKVKCVFEFKNSDDENQAVFLMQSLEGWNVERVFQALAEYRETLIEAHQNWNRYVERVQQSHPMVHNWNSTQDITQSNISYENIPNRRRVTTMTFLDFLKELYL